VVVFPELADYYIEGGNKQRIVKISHERDENKEELMK
jgi:hypothetical protein